MYKCYLKNLIDLFLGFLIFILLIPLLMLLSLFVFFSMAVAAAEVAVGLAILVSIFRNLGSISIDNLKNLKG